MWTSLDDNNEKRWTNLIEERMAIVIISDEEIQAIAFKNRIYI